MVQRGYILILCLSFIALVSVMALSSLTISQLSIRISQSGQQQLQSALTARLRHWQQLADPTTGITTALNVTKLPGAICRLVIDTVTL